MPMKSYTRLLSTFKVCKLPDYYVKCTIMIKVSNVFTSSTSELDCYCIYSEP